MDAPKGPAYRVEWVIEREASSPFEAACFALEVQHHVGHTATVFRVNGELIDLEGDEPSTNGHFYGPVHPWATIASAPKDGRVIDLWSEQVGRWSDMFWHRAYGAWARKEGYPVQTRVFRTLRPTHWSPLPMGPDGSAHHG